MSVVSVRSAIVRLAATMRSLWRGLRRRTDVEAEMREEFLSHLALRTEHLVREGRSPAEAARQARLEFGHLDTHRDAVRASRGLRRFDQLRFSWLDVKLGGRMLVRYPGLTLVAGLAMAFAIATGAATFEVVNLALRPTLPLPDGNRIVGFNYWDRERNTQAFPTSYDLVTWRRQLRSVEVIGGFRLVERNLFVGDDAGEPLQVAEISAAAFRMVRVPPLFGRPLLESDEDPGARPVVVLGYRLWQRRFNGDTTVVGRTVRLGQSQLTVVGVMSEPFVFPVDHQIWTPLKIGVVPPEPARASTLRVFGRLATGVTLAAARSEVNTLTTRAAGEFPKHYEHLIAQVLPYPQSIIWISPDRFGRAAIYSINAFAALLLLLVCGNVALLMFTRAATREREFLVRSALGASRARIITQLFAEALVLGSLAGLLGLVATSGGLHTLDRVLRSGDEPWPFWLATGLSGTTALYASLLALAGAALAGVVPALKITAQDIASRLRQAAPGAGGLRIGGIWTGMMIAQIAATVVFTAVAYVVQRQAAAIASAKTVFPVEQYLAIPVRIDGAEDNEEPLASRVDSGRFAAIVEEVKQRLSTHPSVVGVTVAQHLPLMPHGGMYIEVEGSRTTDSASGGGTAVRTAAVAPDFFRVFQAPIVSGRGFASGDLHAGVNTVIVNQLFVDRVLAGRHPIGHRIREIRRTSDDARSAVNAPEPWLEIVGVVRDLVGDVDSPLRLDSPTRPHLYFPLGRQAWSSSMYIAAHVRGDPAALAPVVREIAKGVSTELRLGNMQPLDEAAGEDARAWKVMSRVILVASTIALLLSLAGIYSVMSFTVARRTREIGVRVALGAGAPRVVFEIFRRPMANVALGVAIGLLLVSGLVLWFAGTVTPHALAILMAYAMAILAVCALACVGPTLRALRVQPTEALSAEV